MTRLQKINRSSFLSIHQYLFAVMVFFLFAASCKPPRVIHIEFEKANGLNVNTSIEFYAVKAGEIRQVIIAPGNPIVVAVALYDNVEIPVDSKFIFVESDSAIVIERGRSPAFLTGGEKIKGIDRRSNIIDIF